MRAGYLLDTNVLAEPLKAAPDPHVLAALEQYGADCAVPAPVWHELHFGVGLLAGPNRSIYRVKNAGSPAGRCRK